MKIKYDREALWGMLLNEYEDLIKDPEKEFIKIIRYLDKICKIEFNLNSYLRSSSKSIILCIRPLIDFSLLSDTPFQYDFICLNRNNSC